MVAGPNNNAETAQNILASISALTEPGSTEADDQIRGQGMSSLANLSENVWDMISLHFALLWSTFCFTNGWNQALQIGGRL